MNDVDNDGPRRFVRRDVQRSVNTEHHEVAEIELRCSTETFEQSDG